MKGIITLCGSTKFKNIFEEVNRRLTWSGSIVLSVGSFHHSENDHDIAGQIIARKVKLDVLHKEKIAISQAIVVINVGGYVGESTKSEIEHAWNLNKEIYWFTNHPELYRLECGIYLTGSQLWSELLDESPDDLKAVPI